MLPTIEHKQTWVCSFHNHEYPKNIQSQMECFFNIIHFYALITNPVKYI